MSYTSNSTGVCTVTTGGAITFVSAGTCSLTAAQAGNANYAAATPVTQRSGPRGRQHDLLPGAPGTAVHQPAADARRNGQLRSRGELHVELDRRVHGDDGWRHHLRVGGTCSLTATQAGNASYAPATPVSQTFMITPGGNVIAFPTPPSTPFTSPPPPFGECQLRSRGQLHVEHDGGLHGDDERLDHLRVGGTCSITAAQAGNATTPRRPR